MKQSNVTVDNTLASAEATSKEALTVLIDVLAYCSYGEVSPAINAELVRRRIAAVASALVREFDLLTNEAESRLDVFATAEELEEFRHVMRELKALVRPEQ